MISYILNKENLGNIRTYNLGIKLAQGKYVWILSPDDRLRSRNIVKKYVALMESDREIGYTFCPAHLIDNCRDMGVYRRSQYCKNDTVLDGQQLVIDIVNNKFEFMAPSVMIRKKCYEQITFFPEDMPHRGDSAMGKRAGELPARRQPACPNAMRMMAAGGCLDSECLRLRSSTRIQIHESLWTDGNH